MSNNTRTMAFQIDETLFQRIKAHLERETTRTGRKLTQREVVLGLIEQALDEAERQAGDSQPDGDVPQPPEYPDHSGEEPGEPKEDLSGSQDE